jgi:hypothetical protein
LASLFQSDAENVGLENSELDQYSCSKLLKEMEALESDDEDEISSMAVDETEMVHLPKALCAEQNGYIGASELPADMYTIPDTLNNNQTGRGNNQQGKEES